MKKLIFLSILSLSLWGNALAQELSRSNLPGNTLTASSDQLKRLDSIVRYTYSSEYDSLRKTKSCYQYNPAGKPIRINQYYWRDDLENWIDGGYMWGMGGGIQYPPFHYESVYPYEFFYDSQGALIMSIAYWRYISDTTQLYRFEYADSGIDGSVMTVSWGNLNYPELGWATIYKIEKKYDEKYNLVLESRSSYIRMETVDDQDIYDWWEELRLEYVEGAIVSNTSRLWVHGGDPEIYKIEYTYDSDLKLIREDIYRCDLQSNCYDDYPYHYFWVYNSGITTREYWNGPREYCNGLVKDQYIYDLDNKMVLHIGYYSSNQTQGSKEVETRFDSDGNLLYERRYEWDYGVQSSRLSSSEYYYYSHISTSIDDLIAHELEIFPNPTSGILNITGLNQPAEVKLYSIQGQLLKSEQQVINTIDISDLPAGVYFLNLTSGDTVLKKTIVKR